MNLIRNNLKTLIWAGFSVMLYIIASQVFHFPEPVTWVFRTIILFLLLQGIRKYAPFRTIDKYGYIITCAFILWLIIGFLRSCHYAEGYWMWKFIINNLLTTLFYSIILISNKIRSFTIQTSHRGSGVAVEAESQKGVVAKEG